jgi:CHASE2 domain-containing sensor protein
MLRNLLRGLWVQFPPVTLRAALAALAVLAIDTFDSFGFDQQADEQAARTIGVIEGPFYGGAERPGQQAVTVVLIDDTSLRQLGWSVPLAYDAQTQLVGALAYYNPAAIFLDFTYSWPQGEDHEAAVRDFVAGLELESGGGRVPIMIGPVRGQTQEDALKLEPLRRLQSVGVDWSSRTWINYPFQAVEGSTSVYAGANAPPPPMAAVALYEAYCTRQRALGNDDACAPNWLPPIRGELALTWGFGASERTTWFNAPSHDCTMPDRSLLTSARVAFEQAWNAVFRAARSSIGRDAAETLCIYSDTVSASQILNPVMAQQQEERLRQLIEHRVVLVGASHSFTSDFHKIPHVGRVPGVYIHAMATDNLITQQRDYIRPPPDLLFDLDLADVAEILLTIALIVIMWNAHLAAQKAGDKRAARRVLWGGAAMGVLVIVTMLVVEPVMLNWPPLNVFGVALLVASVVAMFEQHSEKLASEKNYK